MNYVISTENTCDMSAEFLQQNDVRVAKMPYMVGSEQYGGDSGKEMELAEFYQAMREGEMTRTSLVNKERALEFFEELLKEGKDVLHISFASACSGTYANMVDAAEELNAKYPNKVYVVDSLAESLGQGLLVELVCNYAKDHDITEAKEYADDVKNRVNMLFTVADLTYLARGGRISKASATLANVLNIKPILSVDEEGRLIARSKVFSRKLSLSRLIEKTKAKFSGEYNRILIGNADCIDDAKLVAQKLEQALGAEVEIGNIGPVIGAHSGPGTLAIFFLGNDRVF